MEPETPAAPRVQPERRRAVMEIAAMLMTGVLFLIFENILDRKLEFLIPCILVWTAYLVLRIRADRGCLRDWGLRTDNLRSASGVFLGFFVVGVAALASYRWAAGWRELPGSAWVVFAMYPVWGFVQQFVVQGLLAVNLRRMGLSPAAVAVAAGVLFGLAHVPDMVLAGICVVAGVIWTALFQYRPNLIPLAFTHAWLGALAYYWVLERDPWVELFPPP